jgi:hypothetical protein
MQDYHFLYWSKKELKIKIYNISPFPEEREERGWVKSIRRMDWRLPTNAAV